MIEMPVARAAAAYASQRSTGLATTEQALTTAPPALTPANDPARAETSFGTFLDRQVTEAVQTLQKSESVSAAAIAGKASAQEVVRSVLAAEMTVQTVVAIRDRMVSAYQDIMRMAV